MDAWTSDELERIGKVEELEIESMRRDGSLRQAVTIWVVRVGDGLYVRAVNGPGKGWYRGTRSRLEGRIRAGGVVKEVTFAEETDPAVHDQIDAAYHSKYRHYAQYVPPVVTAQARAATIRLLPRASGAPAR